MAGPVRFARALLLVILGLTVSSVPAQQLSPDVFEPLRYRYIGPVGNRVAAVAGVIGNPLVYYAGAASGGIWKTEDGGTFWEPILDGHPDHAVGALAVAPSDPNVVWAGMGEPHIRSNVSIGNGVYRSTDAGRSWEHRGLEGTGRISRVVIHPTDPDVVYVASLGHGHSPQSERGIYRTTDGGLTWDHILFVDENTGASSLVMDPNNPRILFAGMWQVSIHTWGRESGGPGSGIHMSRDGGDSWVKLEGNGLPSLPVGKIGLCVTRSDSNRIYALIETGDGVPWQGQETESGELWRSDDGGTNWQLVNHDRNLAGRTGYYNNCAASPDDSDEAYFLTAAFVTSIDGGRTGVVQRGRRRAGGDNHDMWIDPSNGDRMIVANDGGLSISVNRGASWRRVQLPIAQMYHVTVDSNVPYNVYGNRQDGPSTRGPSNSRTGGTIPRGMWHSVGGGESGFATPDPKDPDIIWSSASGAGARGGIVVRYNERTRQYRNVEVWPESTGGWPAADLKYRFQWTFPLLISPHDRNTIYVTSQHVHRTTNGGQSWEVISGDLTTNDKSRQGSSGGLTPDNIGVEYCCVIYAFDESPIQQGVLWAGSNDGRVHVSRNGGQKWTDVTGNIPDLLPDGVVRNIDASKWEAGKAYMTIEHHQAGNFQPHVYKTKDYGQTWAKIVDGIADYPLSFARFIHEDPVRPGLLYLGTENALYVSFDDGDHWVSLQNNLPASPVYGIVVQEHFNDLVVGTYGRGFWILDDITPLQQTTPQLLESDFHVFKPRPTYRFHSITSAMTMPNDPSAGRNPPSGASLNYWLKEETDEDVTVTIADASGETVRTFQGSGRQGYNRVWWNLRGEPSTQIQMRTPPAHADWLQPGPDGWRPAPGGRPSILYPPGTYTVTVEVAGQRQSQELTVLKDPHSEGTEQDIRAQFEMLKELWEDAERVAGLINRIEWIRGQLVDVNRMIETRDDAELREAAAQAEASLGDVEGRLFQLRVTGTGQDRVRWPARLVARLSHLAGGVASADFPPTDQQREVHKLLRQRIETAESRLSGAIDGEVSRLNRGLSAAGLPALATEVP